MWSGVVEYVQRGGYAEKYGVRPMRILRDAVSLEMLKNGGRPASGIVEIRSTVEQMFSGGNIYYYDDDNYGPNYL